MTPQHFYYKNKNIIFSVKVKADMNKICCCNLCIGVDSTETAYARQKYALNPMYFTGTADWQTICLAVPMSDEYFTSGSGTPDYDDCWVTVRIGAYNNYWNGFQIKEPQLSLGTTATAWSAAPEDVSADIQQVQDNLDNLEIGGRNLIIGTLNPIATGGTGIYRPHLPGQITNTSGRGTCTVAEHGLRFTNTTANWEYIYFGSSSDSAEPCMLGLEVGQTYTLSADLSWNILSSDTGKANTNTYGMGALLAYSSEANPNNFVTAISDYPLQITQADKGTDMSGRLEFTFTVPADAIRLYLGIRANNTAATHYAVGDYLEARNLKLEKGSKATDWTPAPEDTQAEAEKAKKTATNYMSSDNTGIMVADLKDGEQLPANATGENVFITAGYGEGETAVDMGVHIRNGQEDLAIFSESTRIGKENDSNVSIDNNGIIINKGSKELAKYSSKGITFDEEIPYKIGNDNSYISFEDTDNDNKADSLNIVADSIYFRDTANVNIKDTLNGLQSDLSIAQEDIDLKNNYIKINTSEPSIIISASSNTDNTNLKLESSQLSFQINGQTTATIANDQMNIPTASVTNLFMQSANTSTNIVYEKVWVMRTNGHLSLKTIIRN